MEGLSNSTGLGFVMVGVHPLSISKSTMKTVIFGIHWLTTELALDLNVSSQ